jgi:hypothetical protein
VSDYEKPPKPGHVFIDIVAGVEGGCLTIGDESSSTRIAGPKPWAGGTITQRFSVAISDLRKAVQEYEQESRSE